MEIYDVVYILSVPLYTFAIYYLFNTFFGNSKNRFIENSTYIVFCIAQIGFYFVTTVPIFNLIFGVAFYILISLNYRCRVIKSLINIAYIIMIILSLETFITFVLLNIDTNMFANSESRSPIGIIVIRAVILMSSYSAYRFRKHLNNEYKIPRYHYILQIAILFGVLFLFLTAVNDSNISFVSTLANSIILVLVIIVTISSDEKIHRSLNLYVEKQTLLEQNRSYVNQNKIIHQSNQNTSAIKHDMKNHLISLRTLNRENDSKQIDEYIETLLNEIDIKKEYVDSGNYIIDSILNFKLQSLNEMMESINVEVRVPAQLNVSPYNITVIMGNLIDNSIEALKEIDNNRRLNIQIKFEKGSLIILVENTYNGDSKGLDKKFKETEKLKRTTKRGYGLENVRRIVENCNGSLNIDYSKEVFSVVVLMPYSETTSNEGLDVS